MENYYTLLDVPKDADLLLIKRSFRKKAKTCHPDLYLRASVKERTFQQKKFVQLSQAYETLSSPKKRIIYDNRLNDFLKKTHKTNDQKKQRSSSFYSKSNNLNKNKSFYNSSQNNKFSETEDTLEDLIDEIKIMMDQFGVKFSDPLEILVEWAKKIFKDLTEDIDEKNNNKKDENSNKHKTKVSTAGSKNDKSFKVEDELEHLKKILKSRNKSSDAFKNNNRDEIDEELRRIKKKYRI